MHVIAQMINTYIDNCSLFTIVVRIVACALSLDFGHDGPCLYLSPPLWEERPTNRWEVALATVANQNRGCRIRHSYAADGPVVNLEVHQHVTNIL